jgi:hypothetical protein
MEPSKLLSFSWRRRREERLPKDFGRVPVKEHPNSEIATSFEESPISGILPVRPSLNNKKRFAVFRPERDAYARAESGKKIYTQHNLRRAIDSPGVVFFPIAIHLLKNRAK